MTIERGRRGEERERERDAHIPSSKIALHISTV